MPRCSTRPSGGAGRRTGATRTASGSWPAARWPRRRWPGTPACARPTCASTGPAASAASRTASRPSRRSGTLEHSVAHSGDLVAVAVAGNPVGVDVEQLDERPHPLGGDGDPDGLARLVLSAPSNPRSAAVPADGRPAGLPRRLDQEGSRDQGDRRRPARRVQRGRRGRGRSGPPRVVSWPYQRSPREVTLLDLDAAAGYVAALAVLGPCTAVTARDGSALLAELA